LAGEGAIAAEPAIRGHDVDLGGLPPELEDVAVAEHGVRGREVRIGEGNGGVCREATPGVQVTASKEVHADRRVGISARLDILRAGSAGGGQNKKQRDQNEQPGGTTARHSHGRGSHRTFARVLGMLL
jgi:hypothetical protein